MKDLKKAMEASVYRTVEDYNNRPDTVFRVAEPKIAYVDTTDVRFDTLFTRGLSQHPKALFRPGYCAMVYYLPFAEDQTGNYDAFYAGMRLAMEVNRAIRKELDAMGRLSSICSSMADWNKNHCHYDWDFKLAGYLAGLGTFGPAESFHTEAGCSGRVSVVLFDQKYAKPVEGLTNDDLVQMYNDILTQCCFKEAEGLECSDQLIASCPGHAISRDGIDRELCQKYCSTINSSLPDPELCGKCFKAR